MSQRASSLRLKLTLWYLLVFSTAQVVLLVGITSLRWRSVNEEFRASAGRMAAVMVDSLLTNQDHPDPAAAPAWTGDALKGVIPDGSRFVLGAVRDDTGRILAAWNVKRPDVLPFNAWERGETGAGGAVPSELSRESSRRLGEVDSKLLVVTLPFQRAGSRYYLQVAVRSGVFDQARGPLFDFARIALPIGTLAALLAGWMIAGRAVSPILRLSDAARSVTPEDLSRRIEVETKDGEVSELQTELNSALARLQAGYEALERFMSDVSHELKTPIAVLLTESQVVRMGEARLVRYQEFAREVEREMQRLGELVESFLALARAGIAQSVPVEEVALNDLLLDSVRSCRTIAEQRGVHLVPRLTTPHDDAPGLELTGDAKLLRTMLDNLVRNAIRHSPGGAPVEIGVVELPEESAAQIRVRDHGPGIPAEYIERIFERFVQVPKAAGQIDGNGLGLSIARRVAELHRGTIGVRNEPDGGCTFTVRLPASAPAGRERAQPATQRRREPGAAPASGAS